MSQAIQVESSSGIKRRRGLLRVLRLGSLSHCSEERCGGPHPENTVDSTRGTQRYQGLGTTSGRGGVHIGALLSCRLCCPVGSSSDTSRILVVSKSLWDLKRRDGGVGGEYVLFRAFSQGGTSRGAMARFLEGKER